MYKEMTKILQEKSFGDWGLEKFRVGELDFGAHLQGIPCGEYIKLTHCGKCVMSDTPMEKRTNARFVANAHGDVLIGGLGIGLIVLPIQNNPEICSITILEQSKEVISLIGEQLDFNSKVNIINADVFDWKPPKGRQYDCIYMDIWSYINRDVYKEMVRLKRKYGHYLKHLEQSPKRFNYCWAEWNAKTEFPLF